ncbi:uncharacterized protein LOC135465658 [Liolophura sinensis]|uniref:uncharacterized protein LOC135465658 n=1 Tax=Liolophura sinensis TaxID=3198878 RepID=UPI0031583A96
MMFPWNLFSLSLVVRFLTLTVSGVEISVSPTSLNEGSTLTITCREQSLSQEDFLYKLGLQKANDAEGYNNLLEYSLNLDSGYLLKWGTTIGDIQQRANVTTSFDAGGFFELRIHSVRCSDPASFRCTMTSSASGTTLFSNVQNVSIHGVTQSIQVTGAQDCSTFIDPDCAMCQNFDDKSGIQPKYAKMGQPLELTCSGQLATPQSQNKAIWYKQNVNDQQKVIITVNKTDLVYDPPAPNACTVRGSSTLTYYPQITDRELRISCEISSGSSVDTVSDEMSICVEDVTFRPTPSGPDKCTELLYMYFVGAKALGEVVNGCPPVCQLCDNMAEVSKRFGGGDIAGAVLGGACGGALMALLFTFIILHCTGYTLTGSKENRVTEARRYVQQSHPPRQHHSDPTVTQEPERDATINEDPSCAMAEVSPDYYNVQQDSTVNAPYQMIDHAAQSAPALYERMNPTNNNDGAYVQPRM